MTPGAAKTQANSKSHPPLVFTHPGVAGPSVASDAAASQCEADKRIAERLSGMVDEHRTGKANEQAEDDEDPDDDGSAAAAIPVGLWHINGTSPKMIDKAERPRFEVDTS